LQNPDENTIIRHEAAEAIGAMGDANSLEILSTFAKCEEPIIAETCEIAKGRIEWMQEHDSLPKKLSAAIDPVPAFDVGTFTDTELIAMMGDSSSSLFTRYRALFSLRDSKSAEAIAGIAGALTLPGYSSLFKHELGFVLGELGPDAKSASTLLKATIANTENHEMVRHEAAEALGAVDYDTEARQFLEGFVHNENKIISQSCEVALDIQDYWSADTAS
jgi:deoxyhypusine monooxygenase